MKNEFGEEIIYRNPIVKPTDVAPISYQDKVHLLALGIINFNIIPVFNRFFEIFSDKEIAELHLSSSCAHGCEIVTHPYIQTLHFRYPIQYLGMFIDALAEVEVLAAEFGFKATRSNGARIYTQVRKHEDLADEVSTRILKDTADVFSKYYQEATSTSVETK